MLVCAEGHVETAQRLLEARAGTHLQDSGLLLSDLVTITIIQGYMLKNMVPELKLPGIGMYIYIVEIWF